MPVLTGSFTHGRSETLGAGAGTSLGTTVTAGAINVKGAWVSLGQTTFGWNWLNLMLAQTVASDKVIDIGVSGDGTNWWSIAENIRLAGRKNADTIQSIALPLRIRDGAFVGLRVAASTASHIVRATILGSSVGILGSPGYARAVSLYTPATSRGVTVDPGATANTKGAWAEIDAAAGESVDAIYVMVGQNADVTRTAVASALLDIGMGTASNEFVMLPDLSMYWTTTLDGPQINIGPIPCYIPLGSRVVARAQCTDVAAGDRTMDVGILGFVP